MDKIQKDKIDGCMLELDLVDPKYYRICKMIIHLLLKDRDQRIMLSSYCGIIRK